MNVPLTPIRFLRYAGEQFRDDLAVVCRDQHFTYGEFADRAARFAGALRAEGARSGDRVAFLSTNCHRLLEAYYGVLEADCVLLPLNVRLAPAELSFVLNNSGARFLLVEKILLPLAEAFRRDVPGTIGIFVLPPSLAVLERRLRSRSRDGEAEIARRLETARHEIAAVDEYDFVVVNDDHDLERCVDEMAAIVTAERARLARRRLAVEPILKSFAGSEEK